MLYTSRKSLKINLSSIFTILKHPSVFISRTITEWRTETDEIRADDIEQRLPDDASPAAVDRSRAAHVRPGDLLFACLLDNSQ